MKSVVSTPTAHLARDSLEALKDMPGGIGRFVVGARRDVRCLDPRKPHPARRR